MCRIIRVDSDPAEDNIQRLSRFTVTTDPTTGVMTIDPSTELGTDQRRLSRRGTTTTAARSVTSTASSITQRATTSAAAWSTAAVRRTLTPSTARSYASIRTAPCPRTTRTTTDRKAPTYDAIYATGLRNPFRGGVTPDGQLLLGDVGQNTWEEINLVSARANFGWPAAEGVCPGPGVCQPPTQMGRPIRSTPITSPSVGRRSPRFWSTRATRFGDRYENAVFFADFNKGWIKVVNCNAGYTSCGSADDVHPCGRPYDQAGSGARRQHLSTDFRREAFSASHHKRRAFDRVTAAANRHSPLKRSLTASAVRP